MNKTLILLIASALFVSAFAEASTEEQWELFKAKYGKNYLSEEHDFRFFVFKQNLDRIKVYQQNDAGAEYGVNHLADLTAEEFRSQYLGVNSNRKNSIALSEDEHNYYKPTLTDLPESFDWREHGAVTPVKNQGQCGSCWAFSAIQNVEGQYAIKHNESVVLSEQQLVDCDKVDEGCNGGLMENAFEWLAGAGGAVLESDYPYQGVDGKCKFNKDQVKVQVTGYLNISTNEVEIAKSLVELGPLAIGVDANPWQFYLGGISNPWGCGGELDHGVLLVGFGSGKRYFTETDFWVVKNSWGTGWGEKGYIRIARGSGVCGINTDVTTSVVA